MANYIVRDENGRAYELGSSLGNGGQGIAWRVNGDDRYVIKTLKPPAAVADGSDKTDMILRNAEAYEKYVKKVRRLMAICTLDELTNIAMPIAVLEKPCCGYVMRLMDGMEPIAIQMQADDEHMIPVAGKNSSLAKKLTVLKKTAEIMRQLHSRGLVYCDFSPNNIFVSKRAAHSEVWLIDSDNLVYQNRSKLVIGTPGYRAPEIYSAKSANTFKSDVYSFALIAFEYLTGGRPFDVDDDMNWDNDDNSVGNNPDSFGSLADSGETDYIYEFSDYADGRIPLDYVCTAAVKRLFLRTFGKQGRKEPSTRPSAGEWVEALEEACNTVCECGGDINHSFFAPDCVWCGAMGQKGPKLAVYRMTVTDLAIAADASDDNWEETELSVPSKCFVKQKYFATPVNSKRSFSVDIRALISATDSGMLDKITFLKDGSIKIEIGNFKTKYDGKPLNAGQALHGTVKMFAGTQLKIIIERIK